MNASLPSPKRIRLDPSPSPDDQNPKDTDDLEQDQCTICLQPFLDRTIIPVCAHEFCFECILLWSEQSRKCPLCSRSFDDSYLIHRIRSQYDYQKHYLPPSRSSPLPPLTGESRVNALRNTRRERQWGRRQRRQREEADQLERAIARRRWIYQHHLYAKHIASNPYTRYRPFPTPAQFAASPDLVSRMTIFLRRELRVWPNLDVEFLTTYTISLMKSIDIRSESAVKLLSEFLDLDTPYTAGARRLNAEHFAHEIYSYLRSPYRDLNMYDQTAQYDTPPEISPPREIERGSRWSVERSPSRRSRSRSDSRYRSLVPHRENSVMHSPAARHGRDSSAEARREEQPSRKHSRNRSPRNNPPGREDHTPRNHPFSKRHGRPNGVQDNLRNGHTHLQPGGISYPETSNSTVFVENRDKDIPTQQHFTRGDERGKGQATEKMKEFVYATHAPETSASQSDDSAAALVGDEVDVTQLIDGPSGGPGDEVANYVDKVLDGSSANPQLSRKRLAGLNARVHPRNRTLSQSVQAYLSQPVAPRHSTKKPSVPGDEQPTRVSDTGTTGTSATDHPRLLLRLTNGPTGPDIGKLPPSHGTTIDGTASCDPSVSNDDAASQQQYSDYHSQSCVSSFNRCSSTAAKHPNAITQRGDDVGDGEIWPCRFLSSTDDEASPSADRTHGSLGFPPVPSATPSTRNANAALALADSLVDRRPEPVQTRHGNSRGQGRRVRIELGTTDTGDQARTGDGEPITDDATHLRSDLLARCTLSSSGAAVSLSDHKHGHDDGHTNMDTDAITAVVSSFFHRGERTVCKGDDSVADELCDDASGEHSTSGSGSGSVSTSTATSMSSMQVSISTSELETRLRTRARLRVRLAVMKGTGAVGSVGSITGSGPGPGMDLDSGPGRQGVRDDATVRREKDVHRPNVGMPISGDQGEDGERDVVRDGDGIKDKVKVRYRDRGREELYADRDKEGKGDRDENGDGNGGREVALRGMLRERAGRRGRTDDAVRS